MDDVQWSLTWMLPVLVVVGLLGYWSFVHVRYVLFHRKAGLRVPPGALGDYARETWAFVVIGWWHVRALFSDGLRIPVNATGRPVLAVHGFSQNATNMWGIRQALEARGRPTQGVFMGIMGRPLAGYVPALERALRKLCDEHGPVDVVCHSMGGTILRRVLADNPDLAARVVRIVTVGSPHFGTEAGRGIAVLSDVAEMLPDSAFLADLPTFAESAPDALVTCVYARRDLIVYPNATARLDGAWHVEVTGVGHAGLLTYKHSIDSVVTALCAPAWVQAPAPVTI